jgi:hypothetical protein
MLHRRVTRCNAVRVASSCNEENKLQHRNVPQHTILQRACRDTSIHPTAEAYTLQPFATYACRHNVVRNRQVTLAPYKCIATRPVPTLQRRKAVAG